MSVRTDFTEGGSCERARTARLSRAAADFSRHGARGGGDRGVRLAGKIVTAARAKPGKRRAKPEKRRALAEAERLLIAISRGGQSYAAGGVDDTTSPPLRRLVSAGLIHVRGGVAVLTAAGEALFRRTGGRLRPANQDEFKRQHEARVYVGLWEAREGIVARNLGESPLGWLKRRGAITAAEFRAGMKLRRDFEFAGLAPRVTVNLLGVGGWQEMTSSQLDARQRFNDAMASLDPGNRDILIEICCFNTGLERAGEERDWPKRSAKVVLKLALAALAEYYGMGE